MKKRMCLLLAIWMLVLCLVSCANEVVDQPSAPTSPSKDPYVSRVKGMQAYDEFVYGNYVISSSGTPTIFDRTTQKSEKFCEDPNCNYMDCPVRRGLVRVTGISKGRIYFNTLCSKPYYGYMDLETREITCLLEIEYFELIHMRPMFVDGGWVYLARKHLIKDGDSGRAADYVAHLSRIPEDGGKEEIIYRMRDDSETLALIADGYMYTYYQSKLWRTDLESWEQVVLLDIEQSKFDKIGELCSLDGYLYFVENSGGAKKLVRMDPISAAWSYVVTTPMASYAITNDAVYYVPYEKRQINDPATNPTDSKDAEFTTFSASMYACDHDGGNVRRIWTDKSGEMAFASPFTVVDDVYYGRVTVFDIEKNTWDGSRYRIFSMKE